jgi:hypothetical protein
VRQYRSDLAELSASLITNISRAWGRTLACRPKWRRSCERDGANLTRGMTDMLDALNRKRGKGPQVVRVERVVVHEGGQAIVGNVQPAASKGGEGQG